MVVSNIKLDIEVETKDTHQSTSDTAREDIRRKPATRASWIQKQILNDRPHSHCKPTEGVVQSTLHRIRWLRESLRPSVNSSSTDLASRTGDRRCVNRILEGNIHQQLDDSPPAQRKQQDQHRKRSPTGRYCIVQAVYDSTRKHICFGNQRLEDGEHLCYLHFAGNLLMC